MSTENKDKNPAADTQASVTAGVIKPTHEVINGVWLGGVQWRTGDLLILKDGRLHRIKNGKIEEHKWLNPFYVSNHVKAL